MSTAPGLKLITPAVTPLFTAAEARERARLASSMSDSAINDLVAEATRFTESHLSRQLLIATWRQTQDGFADENGLTKLWRNPVIEIITVEYLDDEGEWQEVDDWRIDNDKEPGLLFPVVGEDWPEPTTELSNVAITFTAGYGDAATDVPADLRRSVIMLVSHFHEHPEAVGLGADARTFEIPLGVRDIWEDYMYGPRF